MIKAIGLAFLLALVGASGCAHHHHGHLSAHRHGDYIYDHYHRLDCGHLVACRYHRGAHHYRPHHGHERYVHMHVHRGGYEPCYVVRGRHHPY